eukprot:Amastigsp_a513183_18.p1 type:complete len:525 gc:universal Amastigsp_a513183_18:59-1633(+)
MLSRLFENLDHALEHARATGRFLFRYNGLMNPLFDADAEAFVAAIADTKATEVVVQPEYYGQSLSAACVKGLAAAAQVMALRRLELVGGCAGEFQSCAPLLALCTTLEELVLESTFCDLWKGEGFVSTCQSLVASLPKLRLLGFEAVLDETSAAAVQRILEARQDIEIVALFCEVRSGPATAEVLQRMPALRRLSARGLFGADDVNFEAALTALALVPRLESLSLLCTFSRPNAARVALLSEQLVRLPLLAHLDLSGVGLAGEAFERVSETLAHLPLLATLTLEGCNLRPVGIRALARALPRTPLLSSLNIAGCGLSSDADSGAAIGELAPVLAQLPRLESLEMGRNTCCLTDDAAAVLGAGLRGMTGLIHMGLSDCLDYFASSQAHSVAGLGALVGVSPLLRSLSLAHGIIRADGAAVVADALMRTPALTTLDLTGCFIGDDGVDTLSDALASASLLRCLGLAENRITCSGAVALAAALLDLPLLESLDVRFNEIGDEGARALESAIELLPRLRFVQGVMPAA